MQRLNKRIDFCSLIWYIIDSQGEITSQVQRKARLSATSTQFLNPEMLISAMKRELGIMSGDPTKEWYTIMREDLLGADITRFK